MLTVTGSNTSHFGQKNPTKILTNTPTEAAGPPKYSARIVMYLSVVWGLWERSGGGFYVYPLLREEGKGRLGFVDMPFFCQTVLPHRLLVTEINQSSEAK